MRRTTDSQTAELRAVPLPDDGDGPRLVPRTIEGYAAVFDRPYDNGAGVVEYVERAAFDGCDFTDVVCAFNHDAHQVLLGRHRPGRSDNTLRLEVREGGLWFSCDLPESRSDIYESIQRGDIEGCSFKFYVEEDRYEKRANGEYDRYITRVGKVADVGPVNYPAYEDTAVEARSIKAATSGEKKPLPLILNADARIKLAEAKAKTA